MKSAIHILTPEQGINIDAGSLISGSPIPWERTALKWFRTMIEFLKVQPFNWPEQSQAWQAVSLGSLDLSLRAVTCSPSNLTQSAGCLIVSLSSNMDLTLWAATRNHLKGEWIELQSITPDIMSSWYADPVLEGASEATFALHGQTTCITWTTQADFQMKPAVTVDASLLIVGNRAGKISFFRFDGSRSLCLVKTVDVSEDTSSQWVTHVSASPWISKQPGHAIVKVAYATSRGTIGYFCIDQQLRLCDDVSSFLFSKAYEVTVETVAGGTLVPQDSRGATTLKWVQTDLKKDIVVVCKPGTVSFWYSVGSSTDDEPVQHRTFRFHTIKLSVASTCLSRPSGIEYLRLKDSVVLSMEDGAFYIVVNASSPAQAQLLHAQRPEPMTADGQDDAIQLGDDPHSFTSEEISTRARRTFVRAESVNSKQGWKDVNRIVGMSTYDHLQTVVWIHESARPSDFSYKHDAKHNSMIVAAQLWDPQAVNDAQSEVRGQLRALDGLRSLLSNPQACHGDAPIHKLRPYLLQLGTPQQLAVNHAQLIDIIGTQSIQETCTIDLENTKLSFASVTDAEQLSIPDEAATLIDFTSAQAGASQTSFACVRSAFRQSLKQHLFGCDETLSMRLRLSLADFAWKTSDNSEMRNEYGMIAQELLNRISHSVLTIIVKHIIAVRSLVRADDLPFILRMVISSLLPGSPPGLAADAHLLADLETDASEKKQDQITEHCPACAAEVPFVEITNARCTNGHSWSRCTVTTFLLATPMVRTCIGCSRKTFLPLSSRAPDDTRNWLPTAARGWVVGEIIEAVSRCVHCGNSFVS